MNNRKIELLPKGRTLDKIEIGEEVTVAELSATGKLRRRLQDVGFCDGTKVSCVFRSPLGDPTAYLVRGVVIALRSETAGEIITVR